MNTTRATIAPVLLALAGGLLASGVAMASAPKGGLLCAIVDAQVCIVRAGCTEVDVEEVDFPRFLVVDLAGSRLHGTRPDGTEASSSIRNSFRQDDRVMLTGVENGRAWSVVLGDEGSFTLAASDVSATYNLFGYCTQR